MRSIVLCGVYAVGLIALAWFWWTIEYEHWPWM